MRMKITVKKLGINGEGIGFYKKKITFIPGALPGEVVFAEVLKETDRFIEASLVKVLQKSEDRVQPVCSKFEECGGCQIMHLDEDAHMMYKRNHLLDALTKYTGINGIENKVQIPIMMDEPYYYRNKAQLQVKRTKERVILGLYAMNSHLIVDLANCYVQDEDINKTIRKIKRILDENPVDISKKGLLSIVVRKSLYSGEQQVTFVTFKEDLLYLKQAMESVFDIKNVVSVAMSVKTDKTPLIFGDKTFVKFGKERITEKLGHVKFNLAPRDFFQLNPVQTIALYDEVKKIITKTNSKKIVDCYCGTGTIGQYVATKNTEIRGMDTIKTAIDSAKINAKNNDIKNFKYEVGDAKMWLGKWHNEGFDPDTIIVDPPRTGLGKDLINTIIKAKPKTLIYVSCNPSTLAKDLKFLKKYYNVQNIQPVDMFPQTSHVESVVELRRR